MLLWAVFNCHGLVVFTQTWQPWLYGAEQTLSVEKQYDSGGCISVHVQTLYSTDFSSKPIVQDLS